MKWNKFTLKTRAEMEDIVIATLAEAGVQGVEIEDRQPLTEYDKQQMFVDILPGDRPILRCTICSKCADLVELLRKSIV